MSEETILFGNKTLIRLSKDLPNYRESVDRLKDLVSSRDSEGFVLSNDDKLFLDSIGVLGAFNRL